MLIKCIEVNAYSIVAFQQVAIFKLCIKISLSYYK